MASTEFIDPETGILRRKTAAQPDSPAVTTTDAPVEQRVFFRDIKPYAVPESLEDLRGPAGGVVELPHSVLWAPGDGRVDLDVEGGIGLAYRAVVAEGTVEDQVRIVNRDRLITVWSELLLPRRARELWEARFPELSAEVST